MSKKMWKRMKSLAVVGLCVGVGLMLAGCSVKGIGSTVDGWIDTLITKDQQKEQGFEVTTKMVYDNFDEELGAIRMKNMGLTEIPDFCKLLSERDYLKVRELSLPANEISLANQDLSCLENLEIVNLSYNNIDAVRDLGDLPNLKELYLHKNALSSLKDIPKFISLEKLNVSYNNLKDFAGIESMTGLLTLEAAHNQLEKIVGVERLEKLQKLKVEFNKLREVSSIEELKNLEFVTAKGNEIQESVINTLEELNEQFRESVGNAAGVAGQKFINQVDEAFDNMME